VDQLIPTIRSFCRKWGPSALFYFFLLATSLLGISSGEAQQTPAPAGSAKKPASGGGFKIPVITHSGTASAAPAATMAPSIPPTPPIRIADESKTEKDQPTSTREARKSRATPDAELHLARVKELMGNARELKELCDPSPAENAEKQFCALFCGEGSSQTGTVPVNLCAFVDPVAANAAVLADWSTAQSLLSARPRPKTKDKSAGVSSLAATGAVGPAGDVANVALNALEVGLSALAKVIEDRAKREGIGWFLQRVGDDLCGLSGARESASSGMAALLKAEGSGLNEEQRKQGEAILLTLKTRANELAMKDGELVRREVRAFWFPSLCALAGTAKSNNGFAQYGGGGKLFEALRSALASDVKSWPGVAAGIALGQAFLSGANDPSKPSSILACTEPEGYGAASGYWERDVCRSVVQLRRAGAVFFGQLRAGKNATSSLFALASRIDAANRQGYGTNAKLYVDGLQVAACAASIPFMFGEYSDVLQLQDRIQTTTTAKEGGAEKKETASAPLSQTNLDRGQRAEALLVAAMVSTPACWTIVGKGVKKSSCGPLRGEKASEPACREGENRALGLGPDTSIERLSTILRLSQRLSAGAKTVEAQWGKLVTALDTYEETAEATAKALNQPSTALTPDLSKVAEGKTLKDILASVEGLIEAQARTAQHSAYVKHLLAALALAEAGIDMGSVTLDAAAGALDSALYPGLSFATGDKLKELQGKLDGAHDALSALSHEVGALRGTLTEDWGAVIAHAAASLRAQVDLVCTGQSCRAGADKLSRYAGFLVAIVSEDDPERLAETLDSLADPIGGWRTKSKPGTFTASLASLAGFAGGFEWRYGQYGAHKENFLRLYAAAPTLVLPVGVDLAWGRGGDGEGEPIISPSGLLISLIDPAAFLQYDASMQGRLPGPQLTTALAPGVWGHFSFKDTPFSLSPFFVIRPGLRSWDAGVSGPSATAFQVGVVAAVDVTLFTLYTGQTDQ
jgi:hypothetical protein